MLSIGQHLFLHGKSPAIVFLETAKEIRSLFSVPIIVTNAAFIAGPHNDSILIDQKKIKEINETIHNGYFLWHGSYTDIFTVPEFDKATAAIERILQKELPVVQETNSRLVIHIGPYLFTDIGQKEMAHFLNEHAQIPHECPIIYFEMTSSKKWMQAMGNRENIIKYLLKIFEELGPRQRKTIGFCIDTAHMWANGFDMRKQSDVSELLSNFIGIPIAFHLNDSELPMGVGRDQHTEIGQGQIWKDDDGWKEVINFARKYNCPIILERADIKNEYELVNAYISD